MKIETYIQSYDCKFEKLVNDESGEQLLHYRRSIWTTWVISFDEIRSKGDAGMAAANLLILWSCLDNRDLWYELFSGATFERHERTFPSWMTHIASDLSNFFLPRMIHIASDQSNSFPSWMTHIASDQLKFSKAMTLLRRYSMIEEVNESGSYSIHPVVHKWAYHYFHNEICEKMGLTAIILMRETLLSTVSFNPVGSLSFHIESLFRLIPHVKSFLEKISTLRDNGRLQNEHIQEFALTLDVLSGFYLPHEGFDNSMIGLRTLKLLNQAVYRQENPPEDATELRMRFGEALRSLEALWSLKGLWKPLHSELRLSARPSLCPPDQFKLTRAGMQTLLWTRIFLYMQSLAIQFLMCCSKHAQV